MIEDESEFSEEVIKRPWWKIWAKREVNLTTVEKTRRGNFGKLVAKSGRVDFDSMKTLEGPELVDECSVLDDFDDDLV